MIAALCASIALRSSDISAAELGKWGEETLDLIRANYSLPNSPYLAEAVRAGGAVSGTAFNWSLGVMLSALNAGAIWEPKLKDDLRQFADTTRDYWNAAGPMAGFSVLPHQEKPDRYYDDNAWMVLALADTSTVLGDTKYLDWAKDALKFCLSGEDDKLGGGIYWKENGKTSKNTCSNAPVAAACLSVYRQTHDTAMLAEAERLYDWTKRTLQDPDDHLMWDNVTVVDGHIERTKWTYNTALMIRSAVNLYELTKKPEYLHDVRQMRVASIQRWLLRPEHALKDDGPFAHLLLESWLIAEQVEPTPKAAREAMFAGPLAYLHDSCRLNGYYGKRFDRAPSPTQSEFQLIDQASAARAFFELASFMKG